MSFKDTNQVANYAENKLVALFQINKFPPKVAIKEYGINISMLLNANRFYKVVNLYRVINIEHARTPISSR